MISINGLTVAYGSFTLLDNLNFHISERDKIGLVGKNGSGKTTIMKLINGLQSPTSGSVDKDLGRIEFYAAFFVVLLYQALAQRHKACGVAVGDVIEPVAGSLDRLQGTLRRLDVRSSDIEVVNLDGRRPERLLHLG